MARAEVSAKIRRVLHSIRIAGYRSVRNFLHDLARVDVFVGPNGCGKSNL